MHQPYPDPPTISNYLNPSPHTINLRSAPTPCYTRGTMQNQHHTQPAVDASLPPSQSDTSFHTQDIPDVHLFTDLNWQTEEEPPYPNNPKYPELFHLLTITQQTLIGYYPHDTHELTQPNPHYIAWAPLQADPSKPILWS